VRRLSEATRRTRLSRQDLVPATLVFGAFTPYLGVPLNVRWEHLIGYGLLVGVTANQRLARHRILGTTTPLTGPWLALGSLAVVSTGLSSTSAGGRFPIERILALADSFLLPVALVLVAGAYAASDPVIWKVQMQRIISLFVILVCLNSLLIISFTADQADSLVRQFWANPATVGIRGTVADRALRGGRYGGIFNQPFDGGVAYTLALMGWTYLFVLHRSRRGLSALLALVSFGLIVVGGVSTGSKVFVYGSVLVVGIAVLARADPARGRFGRAMKTTAVVGLGISAVVALELAVFDRFIERLTAVGSNTSVATGGRWGSFGEYTGSLLDDLSIFGIGIRGAQDDALRAYLQGGGLLGVLLIVLVYRALFLVARRLNHAPSERTLVLGMTLVMLASSFGAVSLQTNRASSVYWIIAGIALGHVSKYRDRRINGIRSFATVSRQTGDDAGRQPQLPDPIP
jgi:hypothetical protein